MMFAVRAIPPLCGIGTATVAPVVTIPPRLGGDPDRAPRQIGKITPGGDAFSFEPAAGIAVTMNGKPVSGLTTIHVSKSPCHRTVSAPAIFYSRYAESAKTLPTSPGCEELLAARVRRVHEPVHRIDAQFSPYQQQQKVLVPSLRESQKSFHTSQCRSNPWRTHTGRFFSFARSPFLRDVQPRSNFATCPTCRRYVQVGTP